jgi:hypothetical protein
MIVGGDEGVIRPEHLGKMCRLVPNARLTTFPSTPHAAIVRRSLDVVPAFLNTAAASNGSP